DTSTSWRDTTVSERAQRRQLDAELERTCERSGRSGVIECECGAGRAERPLIAASFFPQSTERWRGGRTPHKCRVVNGIDPVVACAESRSNAHRRGAMLIRARSSALGEAKHAAQRLRK